MLRAGSQGADVTALQSFLDRVGHNPGPIDGIFGRRTDAAVRAFQSAYRLASDGIVGPNTQGMLARIVGGGAIESGPGLPGPASEQLEEYSDANDSEQADETDEEFESFFVLREGGDEDEGEPLPDENGQAEAG